MPDPDLAQPPDLRTEITSSLASVWKQYAGERPTDARTQIEGNVVRCVIKDAVGDFDRGMAAADQEEGPPPERPQTPATYKRDACAAVTRVTRRRIMAFVSDHDVGTDTATEVFILEAPPGKRRATLPVQSRS